MVLFCYFKFVVFVVVLVFYFLKVYFLCCFEDVFLEKIMGSYDYFGFCLEIENYYLVKRKYLNLSLDYLFMF